MLPRIAKSGLGNSCWCGGGTWGGSSLGRTRSSTAMWCHRSYTTNILILSEEVTTIVLEFNCNSERTPHVTWKVSHHYSWVGSAKRHGLHQYGDRNADLPLKMYELAVLCLVWPAVSIVPGRDLSPPASRNPLKWKCWWPTLGFYASSSTELCPPCKVSVRTAETVSVKSFELLKTKQKMVLLHQRRHFDHTLFFHVPCFEGKRLFVVVLWGQLFFLN